MLCLLWGRTRCVCNPTESRVVSLRAALAAFAAVWWFVSFGRICCSGFDLPLTSSTSTTV